MPEMVPMFLSLIEPTDQGDHDQRRVRYLRIR